MTDLAEFLLARIAEDEAAVRAIHERRCATPAQMFGTDDRGRRYEMPCDCDRHIGRVLAECEAKRRIVEMHGFYQVQTANDGLDWDYVRCVICDIADLAPGEGNWPCPTLRALALPYAYHSDYREEWRP
jgi:hypothetical protein